MGIIVRVAAAVIATCVVPLSASASTMPQAKVDFSADSIMETQGMTISSKIFHTLNKDRVEMNSMGMNSIVINRMDKKVTWMLMPDQKMYTEMDIKEGKKNSKDISDCKVDMKAQGSDVVNGVKTMKNKVNLSCPDKISYSGTMWMTKDNIMMKMDASASTPEGPVSFKMELQNLKIAKQDPKLFEVPAGYEKMSFGGMFGGGFPVNAPAASPPPRKTKVKKYVGSEEGRSYTAEPRDDGRSYTAKPRGKSRKPAPGNTGRSYTAEPRDGRSYTAEPRDDGRSYTAEPWGGRSYTSQRRSLTPSNPIGDPVNKLRNFFGL